MASPSSAVLSAQTRAVVVVVVAAAAAAATRPLAKKRTRRGKEVKVNEFGRKSMMIRAWMVQWGVIVGDKLHIGPATPIAIYIFPTCVISEVHRLFAQWCDTRDMWDEYYVGLDCFEDVFAACSQVRLSRKKGSFKGCSIRLGRADSLAKCHPEEEPGIRVKYEVRFRVLTVFLALLSLLCCRDRSRTAPLPRTPPPWQTHLFDQEQLRHWYYARILLGTQGRGFAPNRAEISIIYGFMDQAKTACPHFKKERVPKNAEGGNQRIFRIMGVKVCLTSAPLFVKRNWDVVWT